MFDVELNGKAQRQHDWSKKGRKTKQRYLDACKKLYGDKDATRTQDTEGIGRANTVCGMAEKERR